MALLPKFVLSPERGITLAQQKVVHALRKGQKQVTISQQGVQFCKEAEFAILRIVPTAKVSGTVNKLVVHFK